MKTFVCIFGINDQRTLHFTFMMLNADVDSSIVACIARTVAHIARTVVRIARTVVRIARTVVRIARTVARIERTVARIERTVVCVASTVVCVASTVVGDAFYGMYDAANWKISKLGTNRRLSIFNFI